MKKAIDLAKWCAPEKEFIVQDWLSMGDVSFLKGEYEVGKSLLAQQLMTAVATDKPWLDIKVKKARAYGIFCESSKRDIIRRQCMIDLLYQVKEPLFESQVQILAREGEDNFLMTFNDKGIGELTPFFHEILEDIRSFQPKLLVLDTISDLFGGDKNNPSHLEVYGWLLCSYSENIKLCCFNM